LLSPSNAPAIAFTAGIAFTIPWVIFPITSDTLLASQPVMKIELTRSSMIDNFLRAFMS
jgi:hypothetical protein